MRARMGYFPLMVALAAGVAAAQSPSRVPSTTDIYCSGTVTNEAVPPDTYLISGEQSKHQVTFAQGDLVYINKGSSQGVKVGDEFLILRPVHERLRNKWFASQWQLLRAMGQTYLDAGRVRVVHAESSVSIAEVVFSCDYVQRGDLALPFAERPAPPFKEEAKFDRFAPVSGRPQAMVVTMKNFAQAGGTNSIIYINLGSGQGVKVGDYFRVFRYQGTRAETVYQNYGMAYRVYGFGSTPKAYTWQDLPREILGEGIVLRVTPNASTVLLTLSLREIYTGDYVEIE